MSTFSDTVPDGAPDSAFDQGATAAQSVLAPTRPFYWSVRRELWEHRAFYIGPLIAGGVVLFGLVLSVINVSHHLHGAWQDKMRGAGELLAIPYGVAAFAILATAIIVGVFYCLGALHNERRDRSLLFWKSLPVSDLTTVLAKAAMPLVVLPVVTFAIILATQMVMVVLNTLALVLHGMDPAMTFTAVPWGRMTLVLAYGLVAVSLWWAPVYAWLLLVSAWAKRAPFLWAVLPPLALCLVEKIAFDTGNLWSVITYRLGGAFEAAFSYPQKGDEVAHDVLPHIDLGGFLATPGLWSGLVFAVACIAGAVWFRRNREPI
jgi:ABC-2 type transport system permease protein